MRDFIDSPAGRYGMHGIDPIITAGVLGGLTSLAGGIIGGKSEKKAQKEASKAAKQQQFNIIKTAELDRRQAEAAAERARFLPGTVFETGSGTAEGGFRLGDEFLTEAQARERGLISEVSSETRQNVPLHEAMGTVQRQMRELRVDPRLTRETRTRLAPELEAMRTQALDFQRAAGLDLQGGAGAATQRELDLLNQLASPGEAEAREQIFGQMQRAGILQATGGANFAQGHEEALQRAKLERELAAIRSGREGQRLAGDIFQLGSTTVGGLHDIESSLSSQQLEQAVAARGIGQSGPFIRTPTFQGQQTFAPDPIQSGIGSALAGFGQQISQADFSSIFPSAGGAPRGAPTGNTQNRSENLFGAFVR